MSHPTPRRPPRTTALRLAVRRAALALAAALGGLTACGGPTAPDAPLFYVLRVHNNRAVPGESGAPTAGVVAGSLRFPTGIRGRGAVVVSATVRTPARDESHTVDARYTRRGDSLALALPDGGAETFVVEEGGRRLRTVATRCGGPCISILIVSEYELSPAAN